MKRLFVGLLILALLAIPVVQVSAEHLAPSTPESRLPVKVHVGAETYSTRTNPDGWWQNYSGMPSSEEITIEAGPISGAPGATFVVGGGVFADHVLGSLPDKVAQLWLDVNRNGVYGDSGDTLYDQVLTDQWGDFRFAPYTVSGATHPLGVKILVGSEPSAMSVDGQFGRW